MLDHIGFPVRDLALSRGFYEKALAPLGYGIVMEVTMEQAGIDSVGFGPPGRPQFWIGGQAKLEGSLHVAFEAEDRTEGAVSSPGIGIMKVPAQVPL